MHIWTRSDADVHSVKPVARPPTESTINTANLHSCALLNLVGMHCCPTFAPSAHLLPLPLSYICTCSSSAVNIIDLHLYRLRNLVKTHCCPTFVHAPRLPSTSPTCLRTRGTHCCPTFVRAARMPSTPLICIRTRCRTSLVRTTVLHSHLLRICRHYSWLPLYVLLVCHQHR